MLNAAAMLLLLLLSEKEPALTEDQDAAPEDQDPSSSCLANAVAGECEGTVMPRGLSLCDMDGVSNRRCDWCRHGCTVKEEPDLHTRQLGVLV